MNETERKEQLQAEQRRGTEVARFLDNETVQAVFQSLELSYYEAWKNSTSPTEREALFARVSAFDDLRSALQGVASSGDRATHELELLKHDNV
jgi:hypothetical protein